MGIDIDLYETNGAEALKSPRGFGGGSVDNNEDVDKTQNPHWKGTALSMSYKRFTQFQARVAEACGCLLFVTWCQLQEMPAAKRAILKSAVDMETEKMEMEEQLDRQNKLFPGVKLFVTSLPTATDHVWSPLQVDELCRLFDRIATNFSSSDGSKDDPFEAEFGVLHLKFQEASLHGWCAVVS
jgi:hypothetical protein